MRDFIHNITNKNISIIILIVGILMVISPENLSHVFIWALGGAMILRGILVMILCLYYRKEEHGPGKVLLYVVMGVMIMYLKAESINIIGVMWAIFSLKEVAEDIDQMWEEKHVYIFCLLSSVVTVSLAIMLMIDPFDHFSIHVKVLGLMIISTTLAKAAGLIKEKFTSR